MSNSLLQFTCPHCNRPLQVSQELAGQRIQCQACDKRVKVPGVARKTGSAEDPSTRSKPVAGVSPYKQSKSSDSSRPTVQSPNLDIDSLLTSSSPSETSSQQESNPAPSSSSSRPTGQSQSTSPGRSSATPSKQPVNESQSQELAPLSLDDDEESSDGDAEIFDLELDAGAFGNAAKAADVFETPSSKDAEPVRQSTDYDATFASAVDDITSDVQSAGEISEFGLGDFGQKRNPFADAIELKSEVKAVCSSDETKTDSKPTPQQIEQTVRRLNLSFRVRCKICDSVLYAKGSQIGKSLRCEDCHSAVKVAIPAKYVLPSDAKVESPDAFVTDATIIEAEESDVDGTETSDVRETANSQKSPVAADPSPAPKLNLTIDEDEDLLLVSDSGSSRGVSEDEDLEIELELSDGDDDLADLELESLEPMVKPSANKSSSPPPREQDLVKKTEQNSAGKATSNESKATGSSSPQVGSDDVAIPDQLPSLDAGNDDDPLGLGDFALEPLQANPSSPPPGWGEKPSPPVQQATTTPKAAASSPSPAPASQSNGTRRPQSHANRGVPATAQVTENAAAIGAFAPTASQTEENLPGWKVKVDTSRPNANTRFQNKTWTEQLDELEVNPVDRDDELLEARLDISIPELILTSMRYLFSFSVLKVWGASTLLGLLTLGTFAIARHPAFLFGRTSFEEADKSGAVLTAIFAVLFVIAASFQTFFTGASMTKLTDRMASGVRRFDVVGELASGEYFGNALSFFIAMLFTFAPAGIFALFVGGLGLIWLMPPAFVIPAFTLYPFVIISIMRNGAPWAIIDPTFIQTIGRYPVMWTKFFIGGVIISIVIAMIAVSFLLIGYLWLIPITSLFIFGCFTYYSCAIGHFAFVINNRLEQDILSEASNAAG